MREYNYDYDMAVVHALYRYGSIGRRRLKKIIESKEYLDKNISFDTFYYHIKRMLIGEYISERNDEWKRGKTLPLSLTPTTSEEVDFNSLVIRYPVNVQSKEKKILQSYHKLMKKGLMTEKHFKSQLMRSKIYYLVFCVLSIKAPTRHLTYPGVSVTDIISERKYGHAFHYLRLEDYRTLVEECVKNLLKLNIIKKVNYLSEQEETRFEFVETLWKDFIKDISNLLDGDIRIRLILVWKHLRRPTAQDRLHFEWCWGQNANGKLIDVCDIFRVNMKKKLDHNKKYWKNLIGDFDCNIVDTIKEISKKYEILFNKHPLVWKTIIETVYPKYLQKKIKNIEKTSKYKHSKYSKLKRAIIKDTLVFSDS